MIINISSEGSYVPEPSLFTHSKYRAWMKTLTKIKIFSELHSYVVFILQMKSYDITVIQWITSFHK